MGLMKCILVCIHHHGIQRILNALKILSSLPIHPSSPQINPWHPLMLLLSYSLAFSRRHIIGITEYVTFQIDFFHWHACSVGKSCPALCTPWIVARQAPLSIGFPIFWKFPVVLWLGLGTFIARASVSIPGWGTKILQAAWHSQKKIFLIKIFVVVLKIYSAKRDMLHLYRIFILPDK